VSYFGNHSRSLRLPFQADAQGIRRAQLGACFAIGAHFSVRSNEQEPCLIVLPTGTGKTAVMTLTPFLLPATLNGPVRRVLVLTPSKIVRRQVAQEFKSLKTLRAAKLIRKNMIPPKVGEVEGFRSSTEKWNELRDLDVAVAIPNSVSAHLDNVTDPPDDLFDVILVDEAHHSPARTWKHVINAFPHARKVFFTATPYRRDRKEIAAALVYTYPLQHALEDGVYQPIDFVPVVPGEGDDSDAALSEAAKQIVEHERAAGRTARIIIRTDVIDEAERLKALYEAQGLLIDTIHSKKSFKVVEEIVESVGAGNLDGIAAVGMLGEGFDLPELKIAVVHSPHKSLASTLQFAGRISRNAPERYGAPKFVAIPKAVNDLTSELFVEDPDWAKLIPELADAAIEGEREFRHFLGNLRKLERTAETISLYGVRPYLSATFHVAKDGVNLSAPLELRGVSVLAHRVTDENNFAVIVTGQTTEPRWSPGGELYYSEYGLFVYYYDATNKLLVENGTDDTLAESIRSALVVGEHAVVPKGKLSGVLSRGEKIVYQQLGLGKTGAAGDNVAAYKTLYGARINGAVQSTDGRVSSPNHVLAKVDGVTTVGFSGSGSVWSTRRVTLDEFFTWAQLTTQAVGESDGILSLPGLPSDFKTFPVERLEAEIIAAEFESRVFDLNATLCHPDGNNVSLLDIDLAPRRLGEHQAEVELKDEYGRVLATATYDCRAQKPFGVASSGGHTVVVDRPGSYPQKISLAAFLEKYPLTLFLADGSTIYNNELKPLPDTYEDLPDDHYVEHALMWENCAIGKEFWSDGEDRSGHDGELSVQESTVEHFKQEFSTAWLLVDHGSPELADVIAILPDALRPELHLFHCKGAKGKPRRQVDDLYEVVGQAVKSSRWVRRNTLMDELQRRLADRAHVAHGDEAALNTFLTQAEPGDFAYFVHTVHPGLNTHGRKDNDTDACTRLLLSTQMWLQQQEVSFRVLAWNRPDGAARWRRGPDA
jgi:superfamily II DNA or RNA helicase